jgi:hypothetical protein
MRVGVDDFNSRNKGSSRVLEAGRYLGLSKDAQFVESFKARSNLQAFNANRLKGRHG